mgnify:FL=1
MPKRVFKIDKFHGGINSNSAARDVEREEFVDGIDVAVDNVGQLSMMEAEAAYGISSQSGTPASNPGYGLFTYNTDVNHAGADINTKWIAASDPANYQIDVYPDDGSNTSWQAAQMDLGTPETGGTKMKPVFYMVDGALRVGDASWPEEFSTGSVSGVDNQWYGFIKRTLFQGVPAAGQKAFTGDWYAVASRPAPPKEVQFSAAEYMQLQKAGDEGDYIEPSAITSATGSGATETIDSDDILDAWGVSSGNGTCTAVNVTVNIKDLIFDAPDGGEDTIFAQADDTAFKFTLKIDTLDSNGTSQGSSIITRQGSIGMVTDAGKMDVAINFKKTVYENGTFKVTLSHAEADLGDGIASIAIPEYGIEILQVNAEQANLDTWASHNWMNNVGDVVNVGLRYFQDTGNTPSPDGSVGAYGWDKTWQIGTSFLYDDFGPTQQESPITMAVHGTKATLTTHTRTGETDAPYLSVFVKYQNSSSVTKFNPRITGCRVYMKTEDEKEWHPQAECNFIKGTIKSFLTGEKYSVQWDNVTHATYPQHIFVIPRVDLLTPHIVDTFRSMSGYDHEEESLNAKYKTATVAGRSVYIGNVSVKKSDGEVLNMPDTMLKCVPNKFDIFPLSRRVDVAIRDGDNIVALENYADRILQFKENSLYIINISRDAEFLEDTYRYKGISHPSSVCKTDFGIAWVNRYGCFLYDGKQVKNLIEEGGLFKISPSNWESFIGSVPMIQYIPSRRQLLVIDNADVPDENYLYNFVTTGWTRGTSRITAGADITNMVVDWDGNVVWGRTGVLKKWSVKTDSTQFKYLTKDLDFGEPGITKRVSKVLLTYKTGTNSGQSNVRVRYKVNGKEDFTSTPGTFVATTNANGTPQSGGSSNYYQSSLNNSTGWITAELIPTADLNCKKVFSLQFQFDYAGSSTIPSGFAINDISIIYRPKPIVNAIVFVQAADTSG